MDKHFNLFQSYNSGSEKDIDSIVQLEDNLTRAFICALSNLEEELQFELISQLFNTDQLTSEETFEYDLQNPSLNMNLSGIKKKILVTIQRHKSEIEKDDLILEDDIIPIITKEYSASDKGRIRKKLKDAKKSKTESISLIEYGMQDIDQSQYSSIINLIGENRADGWIYSRKRIFLIEVKIGNNKVSKYQIYRHLTKKNGFSISPHDVQKGNDCENYTLLDITWSGVYDVMKNTINSGSAKCPANSKDYFLIEEFLKYLKMNGEKMDLSIIAESESIDYDVYKAQFGLFLEEFERRLIKEGIPIKHKGRPKNELWDTFGLKYGDEVQKHPHYSIAFLNERIKISLTTNGKNQITDEKPKELIETYVKDTIEAEENPVLLAQYYLAFVNYRLVDRKGNAIIGENFETFNLYGKFSELQSNVDSFIKMFDFAYDFNKQFELGFEIDFLNFEKIREDEDKTKQLRAKNLELIKNPELIIDQFISFVKGTYHIFLAMGEFKTAKKFKLAFKEIKKEEPYFE